MTFNKSNQKPTERHICMYRNKKDSDNVTMNNFEIKSLFRQTIYYLFNLSGAQSKPDAFCIPLAHGRCFLILVWEPAGVMQSYVVAYNSHVTRCGKNQCWRKNYYNLEMEIWYCQKRPKTTTLNYDWKSQKWCWTVYLGMSARTRQIRLISWLRPEKVWFAILHKTTGQTRIKSRKIKTNPNAYVTNW